MKFFIRVSEDIDKGFTVELGELYQYNSGESKYIKISTLFDSTSSTKVLNKYKEIVDSYDSRYFTKYGYSNEKCLFGNYAVLIPNKDTYKVFGIVPG
jgi:hypothetical protein